MRQTGRANLSQTLCFSWEWAPVFAPAAQVARWRRFALRSDSSSRNPCGLHEHPHPLRVTDRCVRGFVHTRASLTSQRHVGGGSVVEVVAQFALQDLARGVAGELFGGEVDAGGNFEVGEAFFDVGLEFLGSHLGAFA